MVKAEAQPQAQAEAATTLHMEHEVGDSKDRKQREDRKILPVPT